MSIAKLSMASVSVFLFLNAGQLTVHFALLPRCDAARPYYTPWPYACANAPSGDWQQNALGFTSKENTFIQLGLHPKF